MKDVFDSRPVQDYFRTQPDLRTVFLFGSLAKGKARPASDADFAVLLDPSVAQEAYLDKRLRYMSYLSDFVGREADVVILNESGPVLKHQK